VIRIRHLTRFSRIFSSPGFHASTCAPHGCESNRLSNRGACNGRAGVGWPSTERDGDADGAESGTSQVEITDPGTVSFDDFMSSRP